MKDICVIFDLDGTLVDSERQSSQAFLDLIPKLSDPVDELVVRYRGRKLALVLADLEARIGRPLPPDFEPTYRARVSELLESELVAIPGAAEMLQSLSFPYCLASNGPPVKIHLELRVTDLARFFEEKNIFSAYEVGIWKPDPGLFLHAADAMGYPPERCVVIEDSPVGIESAVAAGMKALLYSHHVDHDFPHPALTEFRDLCKLPELLERIAAGKPLQSDPEPN